MKLPWRSIRLLQRGVHLWLFGFLLSTLPAAEWLWSQPVIPPLPAPPGKLAWATHAFATWLSPDLALPAVQVLLLLALRSVVLPSCWYIALVEWMLFSRLVIFSWLAATGGHQLITNVLFWMIFLPAREEQVGRTLVLEAANKASATTASPAPSAPPADCLDASGAYDVAEVRVLRR